MKNPIQHAAIPMRTIGPIKIAGPILQEEVLVPLATFETPLWPSTGRGAAISRLTSGIRTLVPEECMTRSVLVEGPDAEYVSYVARQLQENHEVLMQVVAATSRFTRLQTLHTQLVGNLLYIRFSMTTGDASGHNMTTKAADALLEWMLEHYSKLQYVSISSNYCADKKVSAVNGILGRGKYVVSEILIDRAICEKHLKTTPEKIVNLNIKKNFLGTILAGGVRTANAHFANMLLGIYLATGQDAANIIEGSQGITYAEVRNQDLYFSVTLPNVIVGTIGNGKDLPFVKENLKMLGCLEVRPPGENSRRLAAIIGAIILCGELSLLAAQTNPGELMDSHLRLERLASEEATK